MHYRKWYNKKGKDDDNAESNNGESCSTLSFAEDHLGPRISYLEKMKRFKDLMYLVTKGILFLLEVLKLNDTSQDQSMVQKCEAYSKTALVKFFPLWTL